MSSIYKIVGSGYERYDYGFLQRDLELGFTFEIRQATPLEIAGFEKRLEELLKKE
jgi:hypothetical protein